jgi:hypothetical protein
MLWIICALLCLWVVLQVAVSVQPPRAEQADVAALDKRLEVRLWP